MADLTGELERLAALHRAGSLTDDEFRAAKARLLGDGRLAGERALAEFDAAAERQAEDAAWAWADRPRTRLHNALAGVSFGTGAVLLLVRYFLVPVEPWRTLVGVLALAPAAGGYYGGLPLLEKRRLKEVAARRAELVARIGALPPDDIRPA